VDRKAEVYLYCVRAADHPPPDALSGVDGAPVARLVRGPLAAWYALLPRRAPDEAGLRAHEAVVREALRSATPVPFRFGTWFADEAALAALLSDEAERLLALLARVRGRVEMGVRAVEGAASEPPADAPVPAPAGSGPGRAYLERRREALGAGARRERRAERIAGEVRERLEAGAEVLTTLLPDPTTPCELSFLIPRGEVVSFRERVAALQLEGVELVVSGPWAPYSFVAGERIST
jgi:hypothetical protein